MNTTTNHGRDERVRVLPMEYAVGESLARRMTPLCLGRARSFFDAAKE